MSARTLDAVVRVSKVNGRDVDADSYITEREQADTINAWAAANRVTIAQWFTERDESGSSVEREGLQAAASRAIAGETDGLIVARTNRFARTILGGLTVVGQLDEAGKSFVAVADGIDTAKKDLGSQVGLTIFLMMAEWQWKTIKAQWEDTRTRHVARGVGLGEPFGYRKGADGVLVPVDGEAEAVRDVFAQRAAGMSWTALAERLNARGHTPRRAQRFTHARVSSMIANRVYLGEVSVGSETNPAAHEPIVSEALFEAANERPAATPRRARESYLLAGLIRCASCGVRMAGCAYSKRLADGSSRQYRYYRCRREHSFGSCPAPVRVSADDVEAYVEARFHEMFTDSALIADPVVSNEVALATDALDVAHAAARRYAQASVRLLDVDPDAYEAGIEAHAAAVEAARERLHAARHAGRRSQLPYDLADIWGRLDVEQRRGYLSDTLVVAAAADDRIGVWDVDGHDAPRGLPGIGSDVASLTPLCVPAGAGEQGR